MSLIEISPDAFITKETYDRLVVAAEEAANIKPKDCVIAADCTDEELIEILSKDLRPPLDVTGLSRETIAAGFFSAYVGDMTQTK